PRLPRLCASKDKRFHSACFGLLTNARFLRCFVLSGAHCPDGNSAPPKTLRLERQTFSFSLFWVVDKRSLSSLLWHCSHCPCGNYAPSRTLRLKTERFHFEALYSQILFFFLLCLHFDLDLWNKQKNPRPKSGTRVYC
ncbi:hypothetical protein, partial [Aureibacillus halotolerans]|uniref:hypothetical protein n=1 Tax=Aureibacillus halotolerans TaxID=1508390 RepID=UPI001AAD5ED8